MFPKSGSSAESIALVRTADGTYVPATRIPPSSAAGGPPPSGRNGPSLGTRRMKREFAEIGQAEADGRPAKKSRTEPPANASTEPQSAERQPARLVSSAPQLKPLTLAAGGSSSASSAAAAPDQLPASSGKRVRVRLTDDTWTTVADLAPAPPEKRVRFRLTNDTRTDVTDPALAPASDQPRTPEQMIDENDLRALRSLLQGAASGWSMADKAGLLRHAAGTGNVAAFDLLLEFGALQALRNDVPKVGQQSLLAYAAWGQNPAILDRFARCGMTLHEFPRDALVMAIAFTARKGGMDFLQRLCGAADVAGIRFQPDEMRMIFMHATLWEKNEHCPRASSPVIMEWLMARYVGSFDPSVFSASLWKAVDVGNWPAAEYLLGVCGASAHLTGEGGRSLLMLAAAKGRYGLYELLRFHGADPNATDAEGQSVLHYAVQGPGWRIVADLVLQCRVDTDHRNRDGKTAAELAAQQGRQYLVTLLETQPRHIDYLARL